MEGRAIWQRGSDRAAKYIAEQMRAIGLVPAGDSGYFQKVPGALQPNGRIMGLPRLSDLDTVPAERRRIAVNVIGILPGKGTPLADSVVLVGAHYDHVGIRAPVNGDSIYNGADDDGSGTVAVLEIARIMKTRFYIENPARPLATMAADFQIEMIGRPDTLGMGPGRAWLTGYERSTMGETFQRHGLGIVPDPRPSQSFFTRSDNYAFSQAGIPAHTISSFNLHTDYHQPSDDVSKVDFDHMSKMINVAAKAVWILTEGPAPRWLNGQRPCPRLPGAAGRGRGAAAMTDSARLAAQFPKACG